MTLTLDVWGGPETQPCSDCGGHRVFYSGAVSDSSGTVAVFMTWLYDHDDVREVFTDAIFGSRGEAALDDRVTFGSRTGPMPGSDQPMSSLVTGGEMSPDDTLTGQKLTRRQALKHPLLARFWEINDLILNEIPGVLAHWTGHESRPPKTHVPERGDGEQRRPAHGANHAATWICSTCGDEHDGLATVFGPEAPDAWLIDERRDRRKGECDGDMCVMPQRKGPSRGFIRGHLRLRVLDSDLNYFIWSVWVELTEADFTLNADRWEDPDRAELLPSPGRLATQLPYEQATLGLRVRLFNREPGVVPLVKLDRDQAHALVAEQREGISLHRVTEINEQLLH